VATLGILFGVRSGRFVGGGRWRRGSDCGWELGREESDDDAQRENDGDDEYLEPAEALDVSPQHVFRLLESTHLLTHAHARTNNRYLPGHSPFSRKSGMQVVNKMPPQSVKNRGEYTLIHDLLFLPISTIESAVGKRLITHCRVSRQLVHA